MGSICTQFIRSEWLISRTPVLAKVCGQKVYFHEMFIASVATFSLTNYAMNTELIFLSLAYLEVRNDKSETNWLLLDYESDRSDKLKLTQTGTGGLSELKEALDDSRASYGYVRVSYSNDKESTREKFILVVRIHPS